MKKMVVKLDAPSSESMLDQDRTEEIGIAGDGGRILYTLRMTEDGGLEVTSEMPAKVNGVMKDSKLVIEPKSAQCVVLNRPNYD